MITLERLVECKTKLEEKGKENFIIAVYSPFGILNQTILEIDRIDAPKTKYCGFRECMTYKQICELLDRL